MNDLIVRMVFGSHLYGTATETSDRDYKGIFMPSTRDLLLSRAPKTRSLKTKHGNDAKNTSEDVDEELYSLHYFIELASRGETVALDMLHAPKSMLTDTSRLWDELVWNRQRFYTRNLTSLVGYARRQAAKYGIKGSRLASAKLVLQALHTFEATAPGVRMRDVWNLLPEGEHIYRIETSSPPTYQVCGKLLQSTAQVKHYIPTLEAFVKEYGGRAQAAEENKGIDWKAVSHAFRAGYQVVHILKDGGFSYPLPETDFIRAVKQGSVMYSNAAALLEELIDECEGLAATSALPREVDRDWWDAWLLGTMECHLTYRLSE